MKRFTLLLFVILSFFTGVKSGMSQDAFKKEVVTVLKKQTLEQAAWALKQLPITITAQSSPRSAGTIHDFYSEGDYWWPDSIKVDAPMFSVME